MVIVFSHLDLCVTIRYMGSYPYKQQKTSKYVAEINKIKPVLVNTFVNVAIPPHTA